MYSLVIMVDILTLLTISFLPFGWTKTTPDINTLNVKETIYVVHNVSPNPIVVPTGTVNWTFDVWVRGNFPASGPSWHSALAAATETPDPVVPVSYGGITLPSMGIYERVMDITQYAQYTIYIDNGNPVFTNINLVPIETWDNVSSGGGGGSSFETYSRNTHNFTEAAPYDRILTPQPGDPQLG